MKTPNQNLFNALQDVCGFIAVESEMSEIIDAVKKDNQFEFLNDISKQFHERAKQKGFWEDKREIGTLLMLIVSELSEALEADRKNKHADLETYLNCENVDDIFGHDMEMYLAGAFKVNIKDSFEDEIADVFIRLFDLCGYLKIDIAKHIELKMKYNATREHKYGKKY